MLKRTATLLLASALSGPAHAREVAGAQLPETMSLGGQQLVLNGAGVRRKYGFAIYAGGLYLPQPCADSAAIIAADQPMAVRMHIVYDRLTSQQMIDAILAGFHKATAGDTAPFADELGLLTSSLERVAGGDVADIAYVPGEGVGVVLNGQNKGMIENFAFKKAVYAIWLGPDPVQEGLKRGLLGL